MLRDPILKAQPSPMQVQKKMSTGKGLVSQLNNRLSPSIKGLRKFMTFVLAFHLVSVLQCQLKTCDFASQR